MSKLTMKYFVLKPRGKGIHAMASRAAMHAYARVIRQAHFEFSEEIAQWASREGADVYASEIVDSK